MKNNIADGWYSILLDESTDISISKYLQIAVIYFCNLPKKACFIISTYSGAG